MERYRAQMETPDALAVWAIAGETERRMSVSGPWLKPGRVVEVVPREQYAGAVDALHKIDALLEADINRGAFMVRLEQITADALSLYGGRSEGSAAYPSSGVSSKEDR